MNKLKTVKTTKNYGFIKIKLKTIMDMRNLNRNQVAKATDLSFEVVNNWYSNSTITRIDTDVLAKLCFTLDCSVADLIEYEQ